VRSSTPSFQLAAYIEKTKKEKKKSQGYSYVTTRLFLCIETKDMGDKTIAQLVQLCQVTCFSFCPSFRIRAHFVLAFLAFVLFFFQLVGVAFSHV
jgi:hypothetical protein